MWRVSHATTGQVDDMLRIVETCDADMLLDAAILLVTHPKCGAAGVERLRRAVERRPNDDANIVMSMWGMLAAVGGYVVPDDMAMCLPVLRQGDPLLLIKITRYIWPNKQEREVAMPYLKRMHGALQEGRIVIPHEDGGYSVTFEAPAILRLRYAIEGLMAASS
jgi:hypothetical protein